MKSTITFRTGLDNTDPQATLCDITFPTLHFHQLLVQMVFSGLIWLAIVSVNSTAVWIGVFSASVLILSSAILLTKGKIVESLAILIYLAMIEPALRTYIRPLPYLNLEYLFIVWSMLVLLKLKVKFEVPAIFYTLYLILEFLGINVLSNLENTRSIFVSSITVGAALLVMSRIQLRTLDLHRLFSAILVGVSNLIFIIGYGYANNKSINWTSESNFFSSGGMGPVQISMLLAIGIIIFLVLADRVDAKYLLIYLASAASIGAAMILTFSRNGLYLTIIAVIVYYVLFGRISLRRISILFIFAIVGFYIFQFADQITAAAASNRYMSFASTRTLLIHYGWEMFLDHPIIGVGTGNYSVIIAQAEYFGSISGAHNELIRAAAEHGIVGLTTWLFFALSAIWFGFARTKGKVRALRIALLTIFFAYLAVNGLKLLIQPLILLVALSATEF